MALVGKCTDLTVLIHRMHADLEVYCEAVAQLSRRDGSTTLDSAYARSERARMAFEGARERLKKHIAEHGCVT